MTRVVVVGGDAAGMSAASQALRAAASVGRELSVTVFEATTHTSYSACGLPYLIGGQVAAGPDGLVARTAQEHRAAGIDLQMQTRVTGVDLAARTLTAVGPDGERVVAYDELVWATGALPTNPWGDLPGIAPVKTLDDAAWWLTRMESVEASAGPGTLAIAGGSYIGVEMAEAALDRGWKVRLLTRSRVLSDLDPALSALVAERMQSAGVQVVLDAQVTGVRHEGDRLVAVEHSGGECAADLLVVALGVRPATQLIVDQLPAASVGPSGGLRPDPYGRVVEGLWAAGDCVEVWDRVAAHWAHLPLGTHANKHGRSLGDTLGSGLTRLPFDGALGTSITRFAHGDVHVEIARTGLSQARAEAHGLDVLGLVTEGSTASGYLPEASAMSVKVIAERGTRRLLGVEIVGGRGAGKRVDTAASVLWFGGTVDDLAWMDLSYAPPVATAWEFLQIAARRVAEKL